MVSNNAFNSIKSKKKGYVVVIAADYSLIAEKIM